MSFERLLQPRSIAVFGGAQAQEVIRQSDRMGYKGEIWPVHPKKTEVLGRKVYRSVADLPQSPDAAYVGVNRYLTIDIVRDLAARDAGGAICYATGFVEAGEEGSELEKQLLEASGDMPLVGPNCYGLLNYLNGAMLWPDQQGGRRVEEGVAIITMSSNVGFNLTMQRRGLPVAYMVSLGNKLKFDLHDAIHTFARQEQVTALGLFVETMPDPQAFQDAVCVARELGKPIVAMKVGRSEVAQKMVLSHTASLAGSDDLVSALFERLGVARVHSLEALIETLKVLHVLGPLDGGRIAAMSTSGGDLTLLADALGPSLTMPPLSEAAQLAVSVQVVVPNDSSLVFESVETRSDCACMECARAHGLRVDISDEARFHAAGLCGPGDNAYEQTLGMFTLAEDLLRQAGMEFRDVVRTWIYLRDMDRDYGELNRAQRSFYEARGIDPVPASTGIGGGPVSPTHDLCLGIYAVKAMIGLDA